MNYKAILFDMDGTLVPMDNDVFTKGYFKELAKKLSPLGLTPDALIAAVRTGTKAMVKNDGTQPNVEVFWDTFAKVTGKDVSEFRAQSDAFYVHEFMAAKAYTQENPLAKEAVRLAHLAAEKVVCASNPLFPLTGQQSRMSWVGLVPEDFDLITSYESDSFCKPNPKYFLSICERLGVSPAECLLIGNDEEEDMHTASSVGMDCYLVTDCVIRREQCPWNGRSGTFAEMVEFLRTLSE
jgi:FMN phosphatase YigB (HAD superfamily)